MVDHIMKEDHFGISKILPDSYPLSHHYDKDTSLVWVHKTQGYGLSENRLNRYFTEEEIQDMLDLISPEGGGPDTWLESNIDVFDYYGYDPDDALETFGFKQLEIIPRVIQVLKEVEVEADLSVDK